MKLRKILEEKNLLPIEEYDFIEINEKTESEFLNLILSSDEFKNVKQINHCESNKDLTTILYRDGIEMNETVNLKNISFGPKDSVLLRLKKDSLKPRNLSLKDENGLTEKEGLDKLNRKYDEIVKPGEDYILISRKNS